MSKFSNSSMSRDMPDQRRRDVSRMGLLQSNQPLSSGFGRLGQSSGRLSSLLDLGPSSKMGPQGSRGMMPSGSSSQNLPSIFSFGSRGPQPFPSQPSRDPDRASKIFASFGLSSDDLTELSRYPEEKITAENLPHIIEHLKRRRAEDTALLSYRERISHDTLRPSRDDWDDLKPFRRERFNDRPSGLNPVVDYDHGSRSQKLAYRDRMDMDERLGDRERLRDDLFSEPPFRKLESDYDRLSYLKTPERSMFEKSRGMPSNRNIDDFHGLSPKDYPHFCSLCDIPSNSPKSWHEHINGSYHKKQRLALLELYPEWNGKEKADPYMLHQSTNPAPGILGPPPPAMPMGGGHDDRHGNMRGHLGDEDMPGRRPMLGKMGGGRVVHIMEFERGKSLKFQLLKLAQPFGTITNCLILTSMNEAFLEMANTEQARAVVDYYSSNPAYVFGKRVQVLMSLKYKRIKKNGPMKVEQKPPQVKRAVGSVIHLSNLPHAGHYNDDAVIKLAEAYGKVKTYILMRMKKQAFIEMERPEDAQTMIEYCATTPLIFKNRTVTVGLSQRYKKLVLRIPNDAVDKQKGRKRAHSPDGKNDGKAVKQLKSQKTDTSDADKSSQVVTTEDYDPCTEDTDLVSGSCEPEFAEETGEEEATGLFETGSSVGDEAEMPDNGDLDQQEFSGNKEAQEPPASSTAVGKNKKNSQSYQGNMDDFVTLDEIGDEEDTDGNKKLAVSEITENEPQSSAMASAEESGLDNEQEPEEQKSLTHDENKSASIGSTETRNPTGSDPDSELGPYQPNNPVGVDYVIPKTGFYCKLCSLFYTSEEVAKVTHCSSLAHYQKLKKLLNKTSTTQEKKK